MPETPAASEFEALLAPILDKAYGVAYRLTRNADDAQDLVQETAIQAYVAFNSFTPGTNFKAWFLRILVNRFLNRKRSADRRPQTVPIDDAEDLYLYQHAKQNGLVASGGDPAAAVMSKFDAETVAMALAELPEEFRVVATLYLVEDLSYEEIAAIVNCPIGTVRSRLHRARKALQKALWDYAYERGIVGKK